MALGEDEDEEEDDDDDERNLEDSSRSLSCDAAGADRDDHSDGNADGDVADWTWIKMLFAITIESLCSSSESCSTIHFFFLRAFPSPSDKLSPGNNRETC